MKRKINRKAKKKRLKNRRLNKKWKIKKMNRNNLKLLKVLICIQG